MEGNGFMFVVNPQAGRGRGLAYAKKIEKLFVPWGIKATVIFTAREGLDSAFSLGKRAAEERIHTLVGVGGDGTKSLLLNGMMASGLSSEFLPRLGFIQAGTGNNFAKNVGIPSAFDEALRIIREGNTILVDVGLMSGRSVKKYFLNVASFGFDALIVEKARNFKENCRVIPKDLAYFLTAMREILSGFSSYPVVLSGPNFTFETETCLLAVLNGQTYGAIFNIAPGADLSDGLFDVYSIDKVNKAKAVEILLRVIKGRHVGLPQVRHLKTASLNVFSSVPLPCEVDGEVMPAEKEYRVSVLPRALKVLAPPILAGVQRPLFVQINSPEFQAV